MMTASPASMMVASAPFKLFHAAVLAPHRVLADLAVRGRRQSPNGARAVAGQDGALHPFQEADGGRTPSPAVQRPRPPEPLRI